MDTANNKKKTICITETKTKDEFLTMMSTEVVAFRSHRDRVVTQFSQTRLLKNKLPHKNAVVHMDFAENYSSCGMDEVQSA